MVLEKTLESLLHCKVIKPVNPKGNKSWMFIGKTDAEAEALILLPPDANSWLIGKDPHAGTGWRQKEKRMTENEMIGWHHQLDGHEFEQALGDGEGQGSLACCSPWGRKESDMTGQLNWTEVIWYAMNHGDHYRCLCSEEEMFCNCQSALRRRWDWWQVELIPVPPGNSHQHQKGLFTWDFLQTSPLVPSCPLGTGSSETVLTSLVQSVKGNFRSAEWLLGQKQQQFRVKTNGVFSSLA